MLTQLSLTNWKSFGPEGPANPPLPFAPLTLLVGPNASGKSNVLDALRFLQGDALGFPQAEVLNGHWEGQRLIWPPIRGGIVEAPHVGTVRFTVKSSWKLSDGPATYQISVSTDDSGLPFKRDEITKTAPPDHAGELRRALRGIVFLDIQPSRMRDYQPLSPVLGTSGENISPVLIRLPNDTRGDIVDWLSELCGPQIEDIEFVGTGLKEFMMMLVERGGRRISARSVSDGTLRFLGHLVALLTAPAGTLLVVEEPDIGLHPSRIRLLAELLENVTRDRNIQVIATTHSATLLAHLSPEALANVVAFGRDADTGDTHCRRLGDLPHFETLRDSKDMEHLISTGWLERAL